MGNDTDISPHVTIIKPRSGWQWIDLAEALTRHYAKLEGYRFAPMLKLLGYAGTPGFGASFLVLAAQEPPLSAVGRDDLRSGFSMRKLSAWRGVGSENWRHFNACARAGLMSGKNS